MRGEKTIEFDFPIRYSEAGEFHEATSITVRAPGLGKFQVHATMAGYVADAMKNFAKASTDMPKPVTDDDDDLPEEDDDEQDVMMLMAMGLSVESYPVFADYVKRTLTNSPKLASVGEGSAPITDTVWSSLEENGGMPAVMKVMSEFVNFSFESLASPKVNGKRKPTSSSSRTKADSKKAA